jgi:hypothetical protein
MKRFLTVVGTCLVLAVWLGIEAYSAANNTASWAWGWLLLIVGFYCAHLLNEQHHKRKELEERRHEQLIEAIRESGRAQ